MNKHTEKEEQYLWISMAIGALAGGLLGDYLYGNLFFGTGIGLCIGIALGNIWMRKKQRK